MSEPRGYITPQDEMRDAGFMRPEQGSAPETASERAQRFLDEMPEPGPKGMGDVVSVARLPLPIDGFGAWSKRVRKETGLTDLVMAQSGQYLLLAREGDPVLTCWCHRCDDMRHDAIDCSFPADWNLSRFMIVCPDCGNKRCPKATHHDHGCTGSNEPGQTGSAYA